MKRAILTVFSLVILSSCSGEDSSGSESAVTYAVTTTSVTEHVVIRPEKKATTFTAKIVSYKDGTLTYVHDGVTESIRLEPEGFLNDDGRYYLSDKLSRKIINNRIGYEVQGIITVDPKTGINTCDVFTPNVTGSFTGSDLGKSSAPEDSLVTMKRLEGSRVEFSNGTVSIEADLNDLDTLNKADYPAEAEKVSFRAYQLRDGQLILDSVTFFNGYDERGGMNFNGIDNHGCMRFFGTVQSLEGGRAVILLTDGKTTCDVPTYYNDGELAEGQFVMLTLDSKPELFGSGTEYKSDHAVIATRPEDFIKGFEGYDRTKLAYAIPRENSVYQLDCVLAEE